MAVIQQVLAAATPSSGASLLLDALGVSAAAAYSTRKLRAAYSGSAIRVRRSSDSTEQDIGFSGEDLDVASMLSFVGGPGNNGYVVTWYDQSGNGNNATQSSSGAQAPIVGSDRPFAFNGKAAPIWDIAAYYYTLGSGISTAGGAISAIVVADVTTGSTVRGLIGGSGAGSYLFRINADDKLTNIREQQAVLLETTGTGVSGPNCLISVSASSNQVISINGTEETNTTSPSFTANITQIANTADINIYSGQMSEVIIFQSALSSGIRITAEANISAYWGTP